MQSRSAVLELDQTRTWAWVNGAVKVLLFGAFAIVILFEPAVVEGKAMAFRAPLFLAPAVVVPLVAKTRKWAPYPHVGDALLSAPFLLDTLGNLGGFYDNYPVTDDVLHTVNWVLLVAGFLAFRFRNIDDRRDAVLLGYGFGALLIIWWEIMEWAVSEDGFGGAGGLSLTYEDTIGDLFLSSTGGLIGAVLGTWLLGPRRS